MVHEAWGCTLVVCAFLIQCLSLQSQCPVVPRIDLQRRRQSHLRGVVITERSHMKEGSANRTVGCVGSALLGAALPCRGCHYASPQIGLSVL
jgi:hypothetical protein